ncbi:hypothetical protein FRC07_009387 [Ceratobasidium sp. 392]|nr:hypothetical protein FRC07_009387 [Ceratobasidium sp. 392]
MKEGHRNRGNTLYLGLKYNLEVAKYRSTSGTFGRQNGPSRAGAEDYITTQELSADYEEYFSPSEEPLIAPARDDSASVRQSAGVQGNQPAIARGIEHAKLPPDVHLVAYSPIHQDYFEDYGIAWGVQWEIARLTTVYETFSWQHITEEDILGLCGTNADNAPSVPRTLLAKSPEFANYAKRERLIALPASLSPWDAYDDEETYIRADRDSGLMNEGGGNITQRIYLQIIDDLPVTKATISKLHFKFTLEQPRKSRTCRFSRYLGSRRIIQCHFAARDGRKHQEAIVEFFASKKLLVNGRLFQAFYGHDSKIELMEINEDVGRMPDSLIGDHNRVSLLEFIAWHNNYDLNGKQTLGKWASRFALGFSTSLAALTLTHDNIHFIDDIYASRANQESAEAQEIMTDGCGFLNWVALRTIQENMGWDVFPVHVQARIAGAKGLFVLHPEHRDPREPPQIWIRSSQNKVKLQSKDSWSSFHYVLDVCSGPFFQPSSSITYEMILCLSAQEVPDHVLVELLRKSIEGIARDHEPLHHPHGSKILWDSIYNIHRVLQNKLRQVVSPEQQRAQGFASFRDEEISPEEEVSAKWDAEPDPNSGMPATTQEQVLGWLQAGFSPTDFWVVQGLVCLQKKVLDAAIKKFRITLPKSLRAHIIPDPIGVLAEGEIFFASSQASLETSLGFGNRCVTGPVIVTAVENFRLWSLGYLDVIVFSTQGNCHLASLLSGGDYDGDTVVMIWDEEITDKFINSDLDSTRPSHSFQSDNFDKSPDKVDDLVNRLKSQKHKLETELARTLIQEAVKNKLIGRYNMFYRLSAYINGLDHQDTIRLGHMYTHCLDSAKSGLAVKPDVLQRDVMKWDKEPPECFIQNMPENDESRGTRPKLSQRNPNLPPFILDTLLHVGQEESSLYKDRLSTRRDELNNSNAIDEHLIKPFKDAQQRASRHGFEDDLKQVREHVEKYRKLFREARGNVGEFSPRERWGKAKENISVGDKQETARAVSEAYTLNFPAGLTYFDEISARRVAASYAHYLDGSRPASANSRFSFSFSVAWAELCAIKARATGGSFVTLASGYMDSMVIHKKIAKAYREMNMEIEPV